MSTKRPFLFIPKIPNESWLWLSFHTIIPLALLLSIFFVGQVHINTMLLDMLPRSGKSKAVMEADRIFSEKNSREIIILASSPYFETAKKGATALSEEFVHSPDYESVSLYFDSKVSAELNEFIFNYRFVNAGKETQGLLERGRVSEIAHDALSSAFGFFNFVPLDNIEKDPFLLSQRRIEDFLSSSLLRGGKLSLKEDALAAEKDGNWHVLLRLTLAPHAVTLQAGKNTVGKIYSVAGSVKQTIPELEFYFSGLPFHSYESSSGAQKEISIISSVTLIIILTGFLFTFRSPLPVIFSILAAGFSLGLATAAALLIFREVHIITFVFGTALIGTCVDYSIHFFTHWKGNPSLKDGLYVRKHISKNIIMCFISTEISFLVFLFAPFPILKQFAVFSMTGLLSSFLTVFYIYPYLKVPKKEKRGFTFPPINKKLLMPRTARTVLAALLTVIILSLFLTNFSAVKIENNISSLYTMSASLMESEKLASEIMDHGSPGWYFIVTGSTPEETLENEESLLLRLEEEINRGNLESFLGTSVFIPSIKTQKKTYEAMKALLPLVPAQFEYLGFPPEYTQDFYNEFTAAQKYCYPKDAPSFFGISNLWLGEHGENSYSCVLPVKPKNEENFRTIAEELGFVYFINKTKDISGDLDTLTKTMLFLFLTAYIVISIFVRFMYNWRDWIKICAVPFLMVLTALTVLALNRIPLGFFSIAALVLVFGLGLDYIFYMTGRKNDEKKNLTLLAVVLSFLTTLLSFGALAFSSFAPVHIFGLTVCSGLGAAFIFAILLQTSEV